MSRPVEKSTVALIALFTGSGVLHFVRPGPFVSIVPRSLPHKEQLVAVSGVAELVCAGLLAAPRTRVVGGLASAGLLAGVFPANVSMALRSGRRPAAVRAIAWVRLPLQVPLILVALRAGRGGGSAG
ncbi:hypothetical protein JL107_11765 [Nakamurella flavida]|uniref:Methylamine utilisation protein MauE domain-containing protein n=1 Tax=Nakamurella flavida TaxID=363630 RepID=A0A938YG89_9ACTN|nr:MauE/DoxX family redox-associated membrane protein [Nakamurella flavida]MBM9477126.1 hypothetical protein [Nakamurella flavida]MDP9780072.1 putative membrane protein [Nakamurella flavida]